MAPEESQRGIGAGPRNFAASGLRMVTDYEWWGLGFGDRAAILKHAKAVDQSGAEPTTHLDRGGVAAATNFERCS